MMGKYYKRFADAIDVPVEEVEKFFENKKDAEPSKLKNRCDSLLTENATSCKKQRSTLDLISRHDAIKEIDEVSGEVWTESEADFARGLAMALSIVEALPSADRPKGEWTDNHNGTFTCDQCGCKHSKSNYCPNCGTMMER